MSIVQAKSEKSNERRLLRYPDSILNVFSIFSIFHLFDFTITRFQALVQNFHYLMPLIGFVTLTVGVTSPLSILNLVELGWTLYSATWREPWDYEDANECEPSLMKITNFYNFHPLALKGKLQPDDITNFSETLRGKNLFRSLDLKVDNPHITFLLLSVNIIVEFIYSLSKLYHWYVLLFKWTK